MANVGFKLGPQSAMDVLLGQKTAANAIEGSFYLTSDTHRLYIGCNDGSIQPVNEGIITVTNIEDLPDTRSNPTAYTGRFYYVTGTTQKPINILCIFNGQTWVQLNPDTSVGGVEWSLFEITDNEIKVNNIVYNMVGGNKTPVESNDLTFKGTNGIDIDFVKTIDANNIPHYTITFKGDQYELGATQDGDDVNLALTSDEGHNSNIKFIADKFGTETETNISFGVDADGNVKVGVRDSKNDSMSILGSAVGGFDVQLKDNHGHTIAADFRPQIIIGDTNKETVDFINGKATLDVYSKADIEDTLKALNAMTYRGTIGNPGGSAATRINFDPTTGQLTVYNGQNQVDVSIGDMFMVSTDNITVNGSTKLNIGTLLIAKGTEDPTTGFITTATLAFDVIEATNDTDSTYYFRSLSTTDTNTGGITLVNQNGAEFGVLEIKGDENKHIKIDRGFTSLGNGGYQETLTISHGKVDRQDDIATTAISMASIKVNNIDNYGREVTIPAVTAVTTDENGHITGITVKKYTIQDTCGILSNALYDTTAYDTAAGKSVGIVKSTIGLTSSSGAEDTKDKYLAFSSNSLKITNDDTNGISLGSSTVAHGLQIDLVWGSFS